MLKYNIISQQGRNILKIRSLARIHRDRLARPIPSVITVSTTSSRHHCVSKEMCVSGGSVTSPVSDEACEVSTEVVNTITTHHRETVRGSPQRSRTHHHHCPAGSMRASRIVNTDSEVKRKAFCYHLKPVFNLKPGGSFSDFSRCQIFMIFLDDFGHFQHVGAILRSLQSIYLENFQTNKSDLFCVHGFCLDKFRALVSRVFK